MCRFDSEPFGVLDVTSYAYIYIWWLFGGVVRSFRCFGAREVYGELHRYAQTSFGVLDVAIEAYASEM
jgi:hypothetical protein